MLSRVADALYWAGRYLERAENLARVLLVTDDLSTEIGALDEDLAAAQWRDLGSVFPAGPLAVAGAGRHAEIARSHLRAFFLDADNPTSVHWSLRKARENARSVREALTLEVWVNLNETYREIDALRRRPLPDVPSLRSGLAATHKGLYSTIGAIEHTLSRDQGWQFLKLGEALERVYRTTSILGVKLPPLLAADGERAIELTYTRWRGLLRALASLENYRRRHGARLEPLQVLRFVVFDRELPRSVRYGVGAVKACLEAISSSDDLTPATRLAGKLLAELHYRDDELARRSDWGALLDTVLGELARVHDAVAAQYFAT